MVKVYALFGACVYAFPAAREATIGEIRLELVRHWSIGASTGYVTYKQGLLQVFPPADLTIGEIVGRQGPLRLRTKGGSLLATAPRDLVELFLHRHYVTPLYDHPDCSPVRGARRRHLP